jgi:hypothetical protein
MPPPRRDYQGELEAITRYSDDVKARCVALREASQTLRALLDEHRERRTRIAERLRRLR